MKKLSFSEFLKLVAYHFAVNFLWGALLTIVIPSQVRSIVGQEGKEAALSSVLAMGAVIAMITQPIFGALSDRCTHRLGRRRPLMIIGAILSLIPLFIMGRATTLAAFYVGFLLLQFFVNVSTSSYQGLIPDVVHEDQRNTSASFLGSAMFLGTIVAVALAGPLADRQIYSLIYGISAIIIIVFMIITVTGIKEEQYKVKEEVDLKKFARGFYVNPKEYPDFIWFIVVTFLLMLGFYCVLDFMQYYLEDLLHSQSPAQHTAFVSGAAVIGGAIISFFVGKISDTIGKKKTVSLAAALMAITALVLIFQPSVQIVIFMSIVFGIGYGAFVSIQWSIVTDCLPSAESSAKDMGIWTISIILPQVIAPYIGRAIFALFSTKSLEFAYQMLFMLVLIFEVLGGVLIYKVKRTT